MRAERMRDLCWSESFKRGSFLVGNFQNVQILFCWATQSKSSKAADDKLWRELFQELETLKLLSPVQHFCIKYNLRNLEESDEKLEHKELMAEQFIYNAPEFPKHFGDLPRLYYCHRRVLCYFWLKTDGLVVNIKRNWCRHHIMRKKLILEQQKLKVKFRTHIIYRFGDD